MSITQGAPLPDITQTQTTATAGPSYYTDYLTDLSQAGQTAIGRSPSEMIAGYDPMQNIGYGQVEGAAGAYRPGLTAAGQTAATAAGGITPERLNALMNPYTQNVVDEMARLSQQNVQRNVLPMLKAGFVGGGNLGSRRYAGALGQSLADIQSNLTGQQYGALSKGYSEAMKAALDEGSLMNQAARTQADIAGAEQSLGLTGAGALTKAGAERQAYQQSLLDAPLKTATGASALMRGYTIPTTQTQTFVGPKGQGYYQQSDLDKVLGIMSLIGAVQGGNTNVGRGISSVLGKITGGKGLGEVIGQFPNIFDFGGTDLEDIPTEGGYDDTDIDYSDMLDDSVENSSGYQDYDLDYSFLKD